MAGEKIATLDAADAKGQRQRSTISFPYMALDSAEQMALAIHSNVGRGDCDDSQLAAWTDQSAKSSTFRVQIYASRIFGLLEGESGRHRLTPLGRTIVDPSQAPQARARAFLSVPLYEALYNLYRGGVVPPAAALERDIVSLGVSEKVKDRARSVFERSADIAGFFAHGRNRLVAPGFAPAPDAESEAAPPSEVSERPKLPMPGGGGGGGDMPTGLDPLIAALIQKLPPKDAKWAANERVMWLQMMAMSFQMAYGPVKEITIKEASSGPAPSAGAGVSISASAVAPTRIVEGVISTRPTF